MMWNAWGCARAMALCLSLQATWGGSIDSAERTALGEGADHTAVTQEGRDVDVTRALAGAVVPGFVLGRNFDDDGQGIAYRVRPGKGGAKLKGTDVSGQGNTVTHIENGDWLKYSIEVRESNMYRIVYNLAGDRNVDLSMHMELDGYGCNNAGNDKALGTYMTGNFNTGNWEMQPRRGEGSFWLEKGDHKATICFNRASWLMFGGFQLQLENGQGGGGGGNNGLGGGGLGGGGGGGGNVGGVQVPAAPANNNGFDFDWGDEFNGEGINGDMWEVTTGNGCDVGMCGFGNNEAQSYEYANCFTNGGSLVLEARKGTVPGREPSTYSSCKMVSRYDNGYYMRYGRMEARIQLMAGEGGWPAFWAMPTPVDKSRPHYHQGHYGRWPRSGEIDVMEAIDDMNSVAQTVHFTKPNGEHDWIHCWTGGNYSEGFHEYAVERSPWGEIKWFVDGRQVCQTERNSWNAGYQGSDPNAPFDQDFFVILNYAIGGAWPGNPEASWWPKQTRFDYVRMYKWPQNRKLPEGWEQPEGWDWESGWDGSEQQNWIPEDDDHTKYVDVQGNAPLPHPGKGAYTAQIQQ
ncbi:unnamed protein product [Chrysoparadoxa australica]